MRTIIQLVAGVVVLLSMAPLSTHALNISLGGQVGAGPGTEVIIDDNGVGDTDARLGFLRFDVAPVGAGFTATGLLSEVVPGMITFAGEAAMTLTEFDIVSTDRSVRAIIDFNSSGFAPVEGGGGLVLATVHLEGQYSATDGLIDNADIKHFVTFVNGTTFVLSIPVDAAIAVAAPDFSETFFSQNFEPPVTEMQGIIEVNFGAPGDGIFLPTSASVTLSPRATPDSNSSLVIGLTFLSLLAFHSRARCRQSLPATSRA